MHVYMDGKISMVFNRNCFPKNERLFKVRRLKVTYTVKVVGPVKEMVQDRHLVLHTTITKQHMEYLFVSFPMTLKVIRMM